MVRFIEAFVDNLDLASAGFNRTLPKAELCLNLAIPTIFLNPTCWAVTHNFACLGHVVPKTCMCSVARARQKHMKGAAIVSVGLTHDQAVLFQPVQRTAEGEFPDHRIHRQFTDQDAVTGRCCMDPYPTGIGCGLSS